ncbi:MAG: biotin/lipoyl-binding carrier protein [Usitatibacter sp.]
MANKDVKSEITGSVWKILKAPGDTVGDEDALMILESMKMEIPVMAEVQGRVVEIRVKEGDSIMEGQVLAVIEA